MCEVVTAIVAGVGAAGSLGLNFMGQQSAAGQAADEVEARNDYLRRLQQWKNDRYLKQATSISASTADKTNAMVDRVNQMRRAALFEVERAARGARAASASVAVSRDETAGNTVRALQNEALRMGAETQNVIWTNLEGQIRQANRQLRGIYAQAESALEQAYPDPMAPLGTAPGGPNPLSLILGLAGVGADTYGTYLDLKPATDPAEGGN